MPVDPEIQAVLSLIAGMKPMDQMSLEELRASMVPVPPEKRAPVAEVVDLRTDAGTGLRKYVPDGVRADRSIVYFHGGGFVIGDLETHDHLCRDLANATRCPIIAVDYRRAPEHRFPVPPDDCLAATDWIMRSSTALGCATENPILAGDSAGATLAAVTALRLRDRGGLQPRGQILAYPVTDYHEPPTRSYLENAEGYSLTRRTMIRFWSDYVGAPGEAAHPHAAPLRAAHLSGLPPALVMTAEFDPLRDEGDAYAARLAAEGTTVTHLQYQGLIHGFLRLSLASQRARDAFADIGRWVATL